jgi:tricorn protease
MYRFTAGLVAFTAMSAGLAAGPSPLLLQHPTLSATQIAFVYAGDLWTVPRGGGVAQRLTAETGTVSRPAFSPDGSEIAFTGDYNGNADIPHTGQRAVFAARGEILTVPAEKGDIRDITNTPGADERMPAWSPNGTRIAYFSDESGEYALYIKDQNGLGEAQKIDLGSPGSFFYFPTWSPDSKKLAYTDKRLNLWYVDLEKKTPVRVVHDRFTGPQ